MNMHNPPHPGAFIKATYLKPFNLSTRYLAKALDVAPSTINRVINEESAVSPEMAYRLSLVLGRTPESWLAMQAQYDIYTVQKNAGLNDLKSIDFTNFDDVA